MSTQRRKRVLFVSYLFPPVGGVGVHRVTKFIKYLGEFGWDASVLTVENPSVPLQDDSLLRDIPDSTLIRCARTLEPGYKFKNAVSASAGNAASTAKSAPSLMSRVKGFAKQQAASVARSVGNTLLQPDAQILWHPAAFRAGKQLLDETPARCHHRHRSPVFVAQARSAAGQGVRAAARARLSRRMGDQFELLGKQRPRALDPARAVTNPVQLRSYGRRTARHNTWQCRRIE